MCTRDCVRGEKTKEMQSVAISQNSAAANAGAARAKRGLWGGLTMLERNDLAYRSLTTQMEELKEMATNSDCCLTKRQLLEADINRLYTDGTLAAHWMELDKRMSELY